MTKYVDTPTNEIVPDVVRKDVRVLLAVVQQKVDLLDQGISQSQHLPDRRLRAKHRQAYTALIGRLKTIIAPHKRLPSELFAYIFYLTLPYNFQISVPCRPRIYDPIDRRPWTFGHICSSWRQIALTDYRLWNRIVIRVHFIKPFHRQLLETVLLRSGSAPLDVEMRADCSFMSVSDIVLPQAGRISRLNLHARDPEGLCSFLCNFSLPGHTLSSLTYAGLFFSGRLEIPDGGIRIFGDRPLLRKLTIELHEDQSELLKALRGLHVPFSQLTEVTFNVHSSPHSMLSILKETANLVRCEIRFRDRSFVDDPAFVLALPHLENLNLFSYSVEILIRVLRHITLPSLRQLCAVFSSAWGLVPLVPDAVPSEVLSLINRSSCHLTHIKIRGNLGPIVEHLHRSLVSIDTVSSAFPASAVQRIARRELILPRLEELRCVLNLDTFTDLKNMVEALWSNGDGAHGVTVRTMICSASVRGARRGDFDRWEEEIKVSLKRLSVGGWVVFVEDDEERELDGVSDVDE